MIPSIGCVGTDAPLKREDGREEEIREEKEKDRLKLLLDRFGRQCSPQDFLKE